MTAVQNFSHAQGASDQGPEEDLERTAYSQG